MARAFQKVSGSRVLLTDDTTGNILAKIEAERCWLLPDLVVPAPGDLTSNVLCKRSRSSHSLVVIFHGEADRTWKVGKHASPSCASSCCLADDRQRHIPSAGQAFIAVHELIEDRLPGVALRLLAGCRTHRAPEGRIFD